jgi:tRNA pseudouridine13 synthase
MPLPLPAGDPTLTLPCAHGGPVLEGRLRGAPEDFVVDEELGYQASGEGEHVFLTVRKRGRNTQEVARAIAKLAGVPQVAVGYAGLKDRHALTTQHFTVQLPGREAPDWSLLEEDSLQILSAERHNRKVRRGSLRGNRFLIRVTQVVGDRDLAEQRLRRIEAAGVPNYFGSQRFGRDGQNLVRVNELFAGRGRRPNREQRGLLLSAARSHLFNLVLQARLGDGSWNQAIDGEVLTLSGSQRQFMQDSDDATIAPRLAELDIHPTGPLCGRPGRALVAARAARAIEDRVLLDWAEWLGGLERFGLDADRRALRLAVTDMRWHWRDDVLELGFRLMAGAYATAVLREIVREPDLIETSVFS